MYKTQYKMCTRLAGASDLIAAEAKYHLSCFSASKRSKDKTTGELKARRVSKVLNSAIDMKPKIPENSSLLRGGLMTIGKLVNFARLCWGLSTNFSKI